MCKISIFLEELIYFLFLFIFLHTFTYAYPQTTTKKGCHSNSAGISETASRPSGNGSLEFHNPILHFGIPHRTDRTLDPNPFSRIISHCYIRNDVTVRHRSKFSIMPVETVSSIRPSYQLDKLYRIDHSATRASCQVHSRLP